MPAIIANTCWADFAATRNSAEAEVTIGIAVGVMPPCCCRFSAAQRIALVVQCCSIGLLATLTAIVIVIVAAIVVLAFFPRHTIFQFSAAIGDSPPLVCTSTLI